MRKFSRFLAGREHTMVLADLGRKDYGAYQRHLAEPPAQAVPGGSYLWPSLSPASIARALSVIRSWLRWLAREGLISEDLSRHVTLPKLPQRLRRWHPTS